MVVGERKKCMILEVIHLFNSWIMSAYINQFFFPSLLCIPFLLEAAAIRPTGDTVFTLLVGVSTIVLTSPNPTH
jgi:hypothetical protein